MTKRHAVAVLVAAITLLLMPSARASSTIEIFGHRGIEGPKDGTNENTLWALGRDVQFGVSAEIDGWTTSDGVPVVFHDAKLCRVVAPEALAKFHLPCHTRVDSIPIATYKQLWTKGGEPLMTLNQALRFSGNHDLRLMLEIKYNEISPYWLRSKTDYHQALVWPYMPAKCVGSGDTRHPVTSGFTTQGFYTGVKYLGGCKPTPEQMANAAFRFVITSGSAITASYVAEVHRYGMKIGNFDSGDPVVWQTMFNNGADIIIAPHPSRTERWLKTQ